ncbi:MAG: phage terminase large subunit [Rhodanobacter sp.]|nr:phage terminase large subunit [Rhodanobacter sp.]
MRLLVGPLGSGKTSAAVVEVLRRAQMQGRGTDGMRRVRVAIIRNTFSELKSTTIKSWEMWCPPQYGRLTLGTSPIVHHVQTSELDMEVLFVPLDKPEDVRKLLSLELTFAWIDECREIPKEVLDALTGRVGRYPSKLQGGCTWSGILLTSNPSDTESWLYKLVSDPPEGYAIFRQPSGRGPRAENLDNLPANYYQRIAAGKDAEWIKVFIDGEFGFVVEGKLVYPSFRDSVHVPAERIEPLHGIGLVLGADWGLTPACAILQPWPDGRIVVLDEFVCENSGIVRFAQALAKYMQQHYPDNDVTAAVGDPSGTTRGPDESTVFEIMNQHTPWRWRPASTNEVTLRIEAVSAALNRMVDGKPGFQLNPGCGTLRKGFAGGYHFQKIAAGQGTTYHETPRKNQYSHIHDALQYAVIGIGGANVVLNRERRRMRPRMAEGLDYNPLEPYGPSSNRPPRGVVWGDRWAKPRATVADSDYPILSM